MNDITFVLLGNNITRVPTIGKMLYIERSHPSASALCFRRIEGAMKVETEYFSILDGGEDILLDNFERETIVLCNKLTETGLDIGSALATAPRCLEGRYMHHSVVCRSSAFRLLNLPTTGHFHFESMVYNRLSDRGVVEHNAVVYNWVPSANGAHTWKDTVFARCNGIRWAKKLPLLNISDDGMSILDK